MRRDVSELTNKLDIEKISSLLSIPEHNITGALKRKTLQYVHGKQELFRFDKPVSSVEGGTALFLEPFKAIRGFPKISRTLMLYPALLKHFSSCRKVAVEEKMNGYNVRVALIGDKVVALTRGGFICPYTTEKVNYLLRRDFFHDHPDLVLCGEMVGPDSPYVPKTFYNIESLDFFTFDVRKINSGAPMSVMERRKLMDEYGIRSVHLYGEFEVGKAHEAITDIIKSFGNTLREGVVIKDPEMILPPVKYTSSLSNCADLKYAFEFYNDFGRDFFFGRVCREAFQSVEWDENEESITKRCRELGESILLPMISTIKKKKAGERIAENVQLRVKNLKTIAEFEDYLRLLGVDAVFGHPEKIGDEYLVRIRKIHQSTNDKTETILGGQMWS
ncbi:MAG: RNA ligase [Candidatus Methanoperedenaceae archaeon]|nr:MAG: RNA ligase [Candidatus Methanoperedenaceae archaeon]